MDMQHIRSRMQAWVPCINIATHIIGILVIVLAIPYVILSCTIPLAPWATFPATEASASTQVATETTQPAGTHPSDVTDQTREMAARMEPMFKIQGIFGALNFIGYGLVAFVLGQFLSYLFDEKREQSFLLRYADQWIRIWAIISFLGGVALQIFLTVKVFNIVLVFYIPLSIMFLALPKTFILLVFAMILKRVLPILEESRRVV